MKRVFILGFIFFLAAGLTAAPITITSPKSGDVWTAGETYAITWTKSGQMDDQVRIVLLDKTKNKIVLKIVLSTANTANNNSYSWLVPMTLAPDSYYVRIKTLDDQVMTHSELFAVGPPSVQMAKRKKLQPKVAQDATMLTINPMLQAQTYVAFASPTANVKWEKGVTYPIQWKWNGPMLMRATLTLVGTGKSEVIAANIPNNGEFKWFVPWSISEGTYQIKLDANVTATSDYFLVVKPLPPVVPCNSANVNDDLECEINKYRKTLGLQNIPHSPQMRQVAEAHVKDLAVNNPEAACNGNMHSWSNKGTWKGGCYDPNNSSTYPIMWDKPQEIAGFATYGYEIAAGGTATPASALSTWQGSPLHNNVIVNQGMWTQPWKGMGAAIYGGYAVAWFYK